MRVKSPKKEIIILRHNGGQLGNQLLLFTSVYAYCLEKGSKCANLSFFEYNRFFDIPATNLLTRIFERLNSLNFYKKHVVIYLIYKYLSYLIPLFKKGKLIQENPSETTYLPPTPPVNNSSKYIVREMEGCKDTIIYLDGWTFRNPVGLKKYRKQIIKNFQPKNKIIRKAQQFVKSLKEKYYLVGIHIRQGEYKSKNFRTDGFYFKESEVADILRYYLKKEHKDSKTILFILCSDQPLDLSFFSEFRIQKGIGTMMEDLITLSMCNIIIGSNSTFGSWAAYFGNIPFFIFDRDKKYIKAKGNNLMQGI